MKIISYNVNGIRAAIKKNFITWLQHTNADVICLQEIKAQEDQINLNDFEAIGYKHQYWYPAQKKGYSGVAILSKIKPNNVQFGTGIDAMDAEGRNVRIDFDKVSIMSLYLPSGTNIERLDFKFTYMDQFQDYINQLKQTLPNLVICGDYNICHQEIDIHNPKMKGVSGFLPEEREWLGKFIDSGFVDSFRYLHPNKQEYTWWSYRANAREKNLGWRLDYAMVTNSIKNNIQRASILAAAHHSDHCPIALELKF